MNPLFLSCLTLWSTLTSSAMFVSDYWEWVGGKTLSGPKHTRLTTGALRLRKTDKMAAVPRISSGQCPLLPQGRTKWCPFRSALLGANHALIQIIYIQTVVCIPIWWMIYIFVGYIVYLLFDIICFIILMSLMFMPVSDTFWQVKLLFFSYFYFGVPILVPA